MFLLRVFLAGLVLVECLTSARYVGQGSDDWFENDWREISARLEARQSSGSNGPKCRPACGACGSSCSSGTASKRDFIDLVAPNDTILREYSAENEIHRLHKRDFANVRQTQIGPFLQGKTDSLVSTKDNPGTNLINLLYSTDQNDYTFAALRKFSDFSSNILNLGVQRLEGCTVVTVVSSKAVYMGHFFETLAFIGGGTLNIDAAFQQNCLNLITGTGATWRVRGDSLDPSLFTGSNGPAMAFIMTPRQDQADPTPGNANPPVPGPNTQLYGPRIAQITQTLTTLIPGLTIVYYNYIARNPKQITQAYQGKALFEYDPNADGLGNPNFRVWFEQATEDGRSLGLFQ